LFLVDSGSSSCFIDQAKAALLTGCQPLPTPVPVEVVGGTILHSTCHFPQLRWTVDGATFSDSFKVLTLSSYDGIIGLDWLGKYSPMVTDWDQGWLAIPHNGRQVILHSGLTPLCTHALVELNLLNETADAKPVIPDAVQAILDKFASVFTTPSGLPPCRQYDHHIPLILGARPVSVRPYRVAPELKDEIESQLKEMLDYGVITLSQSAFGSPVLLVRKEDKYWQLVID
jgi:hypothetical protein